MLVKHKKLLNKSCGVAIAVFICCFGLMYAQQNSAQLVFSDLDAKKKEIANGIGIGETAVTGTARVINKLTDPDAVVREGDILVTDMTYDELFPIMKICAGIITNHGGRQCHAALFGKQHGIPVIVGTGNATKKIKNGDIITLDCSENGIGRVYSATLNDLSRQQAPIVHRNSSAVVLYEQSGAHNAVIEHKNTHQYYQHDAQQHDHKDVQVIPCESQKLYITQEVFNQHYPRFVADIVSTKSKYWWGKKTRTIEIGAIAQGCDDFSLKCIPVADDFFLNLSEADIRSMVKSLPSRYLYYINRLIERCSSRPDDMNWISRISHEEHIRTISLPADVNKEELIKDPTKYKKIIDQKKVDAKERHLLIAAGLFARYWCENKCNA